MEGKKMNSRAIIEKCINDMRRRLAEAYLDEQVDYEKVLSLSIELDRLILLDMKMCRSDRKAG
jgi:hypothetical protein